MCSLKLKLKILLHELKQTYVENIVLFSTRNYWVNICNITIAEWFYFESWSMRCDCLGPHKLVGWTWLLNASGIVFVLFWVSRIVIISLPGDHIIIILLFLLLLSRVKKKTRDTFRLIYNAIKRLTWCRLWRLAAFVCYVLLNRHGISNSVTHLCYIVTRC